MKHLNIPATRVFNKLLAKNKTMIDTSDAFMPVYISKVADLEGGTVYSLAHYYEQNGDYMADPEMMFMEKSGTIFPISFRQDSLGISRESVALIDGKPQVQNLTLQYDQAAFANKWLQNINRQQNL